MEFTNAKEPKTKPLLWCRCYGVSSLPLGAYAYVRLYLLCSENCLDDWIWTFSGCCFPKQGHREAIFLQCLTCVSKSRDNFHQARFAENPKDSEALQIVSQKNRALHVFHPYYAPAFPSLILDHRNQQQRWVNSCRGSQHEQLELPWTLT